MCVYIYKEHMTFISISILILYHFYKPNVKLILAWHDIHGLLVDGAAGDALYLGTLVPYDVSETAQEFLPERWELSLPIWGISSKN